MDFSVNANRIINILENSGYEAFFVGGCVRDFFMHREFNDVDITTNALPKQTEKVLDDNEIRYVETGLKHGTITAVIGKETFEITTYRTDGSYYDNRHPESVNFVSDINQDLSRRDFTINSIAYNDKFGTVDPFDGKSDLNNKIIKAVGNPDTRFKEDALRIMRALRFASVLSFDIDRQTKNAIFNNMLLLKNVSAERIYSELSKLLLGDNVFKILMEYKEVFGVILPQVKHIFNIEQNTKWHIYDVWEHTCKSVEYAPKDLSLRLTMLFHDIGKAFTKTTDDFGCDHFKGHQKVSLEYATDALDFLKAPNNIRRVVETLVPIHDIHISTDTKNIKKWMSKLGVDMFFNLLEVKKSDKLAQNPVYTESELENLFIIERIAKKIIENDEPLTIKDLNISGRDLINLNLHGPQIGGMLNFLLDNVINGTVNNNHNELVEFAKLNKYTFSTNQSIIKY